MLRDGMAVANTYTLERLWGSRIVVKGRGFLLNNNMFGFNRFPGHTDTTGMLGTAPNTVAPGKRPISSMAPVIVTENGRVKLVTGSPGSQGIPHTLLCIIVNTFDFNMPLPEAVEAPRIHHQWMPDELTYERFGASPDTLVLLTAKGHAVHERQSYEGCYQGDAESIAIDPQTNLRLGAADPRRSDAHAAGY